MPVLQHQLMTHLGLAHPPVLGYKIAIRHAHVFVYDCASAKNGNPSRSRGRTLLTGTAGLIDTLVPLIPLTC